MSERRWLNCRLIDLQERLDEQGQGVSLPVISRLLKQNDYSLKANVKQTEGKRHPDRNQQFEYIREQQTVQQAKGQPVISRYQEEGTGGRFQESWSGLVPDPRTGQGPRFP
jgi:hypothetical protein